MSNHRILNTRTPRVDAADKATGKALYTDDLKRPCLLTGAILHSPLAHARILNIDTSRAEKLSGVRAVVTHREAGTTPYGVSPARYDETVFCHDKVRYVGDEIAAVAAIDLDTALEATSLIKVDFEELPTVLDGRTAMDEGQPQLHEMYKNNICAQVHWHFGDIEKGRHESHLIRTDRLSSKMQDAAFLEPQSILAETSSSGNLTMWSSTQAPHYIQRTLAMALNIPLHKVRVIKPAVGGGFGPKASCSSAELATCLLAIKTGQPVKLTFDREQVFLHSRARHQFFHTMTTGVKKDGSLAFLEHECVLDGGAYASFGIATIYYSGSLLGGPYRLKNMKYDGHRVVTNKPACGAQRGHGAVIARALFEVQLDRIAEELGMDPIELRLKNVMEAGETTCNELFVSSFGMREALEAVRDSAAWKKKRSSGGKTRRDGKGIGAACGFFVSGAGYPIYRSRTYHCTVVTKVDEVGGGVTVSSGAADIGQGSDTVLAMITAEELGLSLDEVRVLSGDSSLSVDLGAYSSRTTLMTGHACREAALDVKKQILEAVAGMLEIPSETLDLRDGQVVSLAGELDFSKIRKEYLQEHKGFSDLPDAPQLTFAEASRIAFLELGTIIGTGKYRPPPLGGSFKGAKVGTSPAFGCSAQIAEVTVDLKTGEITVGHITGAHDCGYAINVTQVEGQMQGSMMMGMGEALMEQIIYDNKGRIVNANLAEYKIPTALDMPHLDAIIIESNEPSGPYGAKEVGEGAIMPVIPSILNAIYDATGVRIDELPVTPERLIAALRSKNDKREADA
ncbi:MAG: molybdopterin-dependent oxidoreductase [candidate division Zixibacteria bacterium]|nr:molybdopterin-dependent oxidoreductase [candidate division Zixibacteria bacterium]MBU1470067.1 molybdopterin-dependent oxidoreductase [candidate division Zixibacteria bacterium]MBU2624387.1 molybdopterin-dependent oxidoreductase [candidate division Zixibacteria bacterium]